ncbi:site-specific DNA-methyltransferase [Prosthecochloris vibrioformis]|uniref:Site-specific DNA-methyltransferase n=1 Tax=Prosthecochloris vibrioformis TaxID=1098 RepID=A0A5C4RT96_PROVB|nr:site-specific DNA-methyltransferase [Prosthecochloris vibrioformis]
MTQSKLPGFDPEPVTSNQQPVTCLGIEFPSDEARRQHFTELLRERLRDPDFRKIEGFPIGSDEDILNLSDPPYYTACPNPWIADFIRLWEAEKPAVRSAESEVREDADVAHPASRIPHSSYHREPFAADVSEGKNDPIYNAHSYHTKVPHKAIMRYILHYTEPGDIVFDGFCGTGMTGVAAQMCGDREVVISLGYQVKPDGTILQEEIDEDGKKVWKQFSKLGSRRAVLNDLSPAATFIAYNYNTPADVAAFEKEAKRILKEVEKEYGWMYETLHTDGKTKGRIDYVVWSEVFSCPECAGEVVFLEEAMDMETKRVMKEYPCPHCKALISKQKMSRTFESYYDSLLNETKERPKRKPIQIAYRVGKAKHSKSPDKDDLKILERIAALDIPDSVRANEYPYENMWEAPRMLSRGITHVHHLFLLRQLYSVGFIWKKISEVHSYQIRQMLRFWIDQSIPGMSVLNRFQPIQHGRDGGSQVNRQMSGVYYVPSQISECSPWYNLSGKLSRLSKAFKSSKSTLGGCHIGTGSSTHLNIEPDSLDYVFIDPPFGDNFAYAELNFLVESWLGVMTDMKPEAIVDRSKKNRESQKGLSEYRQLMTACFQEVYRILKPGRWMTVEFSNTKASVWNSIQVALTDAGFIVANVSALDKQQGSFKAVTTPTAVKQDLVISAYKPNGGFEARFQKEAQTEEGVWDFVRTHLKYLNPFKPQGIPERDPRILFDQMIAFYVRKGYPVPISSQEFQIGLAQRFIERDGMYFLPDQVAEYDRKKMNAPVPEEFLDTLFVKDEATAIEWLRARLRKKPQSFADINPQFMQQLGGWSKNEAQLDLRELLHQNFLSYDGKGSIPAQIVSWMMKSSTLRELISAEVRSAKCEKEDSGALRTTHPALLREAENRWYVPDPNKAGDLEKLREKALLKEFEEYKEVKKKLKVFRLEAVRAGFKKAWQERDYAVIVAVADKIPNNVLEEDPKLLMWYDQAVTRMGGE